MDILQKLVKAIIEGEEVGPELAHEALDEGIAPTDVVSEAIAPAMATVGERMETGEYFIPEVLISARIAQRTAETVKPLLTQSDEAQSMGKVVIGTIEGDLHSIGKDITKMLLEAGGFEVIDLGIDVASRQFVTAAMEKRADIVAISALLTTTMPSMENVIKELEESGYRDQVKVMVGGAPVTQNFANQIGADGYGESAAAGARLARSWVT